MPKLTLIGALLFTLAGCGSSPARSGDPSGDENDVTGGDAGGGDPTPVGDAGGGDPTPVGDAGGGDPTLAGDDSGAPGGDDDPFPMTCSSCHGNDQNPAPPVGLGGVSDPSDAGVGAHQSHVLPSTWHRTVGCGECHLVPQAVADDGHIDTSLPAELTWGFPATADSAGPLTWDGATCANVYCHGSTLHGPVDGGTVARQPEWTVVDGSYASCGDTCHTNPPGPPHANVTACGVCHQDVVSSYDSTDPAATVWRDASRHIDGVLDVGGLTCTSCHGDAAAGHINPPVGTSGETATTAPAVGAHEAHLEPDTGWRANITCTACHALPGSVRHSNGVTDFAWGAPANADGANPSYDAGTTTCSGVYCHGATLLGPNTGGSVARTPDWTQVNGTWDACGETCHTTPPGGSHPNSDACHTCHAAVISSFDPANPGATVWADPTLHINGSVEVAGMSCTGCHGDAGTGDINPPRGVDGETTTDTLAVGRHTEHVTASTSHVALACDTCHVVPAASDLTHTDEHVSSADLSTAGHHGDVTFSGRAAGMAWDVDATAGAPVDRRGTCTGACHSDGAGGAPQVLPYWAGGTWDATPCDNCHPQRPSSGRHGKSDHNEPCGVCHATTDPASHVNGQTDVNSTINGLTYDPTGCRSNGGPSCDGSCHDSHDNKCWYR